MPFCALVPYPLDISEASEAIDTAKVTSGKTLYFPKYASSALVLSPDVCCTFFDDPS